MVSERPPKRINFTAAISGAASDEERNGLAARWLMQEFDSYYSESRQFPGLAQQAFEARDPAQSLALSKRRLSIFRERIQTLGTTLAEVFPQLGENEKLWASVERQFLPGIESRYEADLAFAFFNSVRRKIYKDEWKPVAYAFGAWAATKDASLRDAAANGLFGRVKAMLEDLKQRLHTRGSMKVNDIFHEAFDGRIADRQQDITRLRDCQNHLLESQEAIDPRENGSAT